MRSSLPATSDVVATMAKIFFSAASLAGLLLTSIACGDAGTDDEGTDGVSDEGSAEVRVERRTARPWREGPSPAGANDGGRDRGQDRADPAGPDPARGLEEAFLSWDREPDGRVSRDEFDERLYAEWDLNGDDIVSEVEWLEGVEAWLSPETGRGGWEQWDRDGDADLDPEEFSLGVTRDGIYGRLDRNESGALEMDELDGWISENA